ncbi:hypothetical protein HUJ05_002790 [Dendroctonus ponderosae]|nr:hypothetical protein HUJ05_002790 [Dendroctonus ponderosae]
MTILKKHVNFDTRDTTSHPIMGILNGITCRVIPNIEGLQVIEHNEMLLKMKLCQSSPYYPNSKSNHQKCIRSGSYTCDLLQTHKNITPSYSTTVTKSNILSGIVRTS